MKILNSRKVYELTIRENKIILNGDIYYREEDINKAKSYRNTDYNNYYRQRQSTYKQAISNRQTLVTVPTGKVVYYDEILCQTDLEKEIERLKKKAKKLKIDIEEKERVLFRMKKNKL